MKIWTFRDNKFEAKELIGHDDWVRDVAWCNNIGLLYDTIASCSEDKKVKVWKRDPTNDEWRDKEIALDTPIWKVSWSQIGNMLAVSGGDN